MRAAADGFLHKSRAGAPPHWNGRGIPIFHPSTLVQHYLRPEEMAPVYSQALQHARQQQGREGAAATTHGIAEANGSTAGLGGGSGGQGGGGGLSVGAEGDPAAQLYYQLVAMGLLRR